MDSEHFLLLIVRPTINAIGMGGRAAEVLMLGTALTESGLKWLKQIGGGPGRGLYQMEPATHKDVWRYLDRSDNHSIRRAVISFMVPPAQKSIEKQIVWNLAYATAVARMKYWMQPDPLPAWYDAAGMAAYHKKWYNSARGKTDPAASVAHFRTAGRVVDRSAG